MQATEVAAKVLDCLEEYVELDDIHGVMEAEVRLCVVRLHVSARHVFTKGPSHHVMLASIAASSLQQ